MRAAGDAGAARPGARPALPHLRAWPAPATAPACSGRTRRATARRSTPARFDWTNGTVYSCAYDGAVTVNIDGAPWSRTWWSMGGDSRHRVQPRREGPHGHLGHPVRRRLRGVAGLAAAAAAARARPAEAHDGPHLVPCPGGSLCAAGAPAHRAGPGRGGEQLQPVRHRRRRRRLERQPRSRAEALATAARAAADRAGTSASAWGRSTSRNFERLGLDAGLRLRPCRNLAAMQTVLGECYDRADAERHRPASTALRQALSCYYSGNFITGFRDGYVRRVVAAAASDSVRRHRAGGPSTQPEGAFMNRLHPHPRAASAPPLSALARQPALVALAARASTRSTTRSPTSTPSW